MPSQVPCWQNICPSTPVHDPPEASIPCPRSHSRGETKGRPWLGRTLMTPSQPSFASYVYRHRKDIRPSPCDADQRQHPPGSIPGLALLRQTIRKMQLAHTAGREAPQWKLGNSVRVFALVVCSSRKLTVRCTSSCRYSSPGHY